MAQIEKAIKVRKRMITAQLLHNKRLTFKS